MAGRKIYEGPQDLPGVIPIFPLANALLLPGGQLPLNIFEPRYVEMIDDALKSDRLIGMIQPTSDAEASRATPKLADVGCVGRLTQFAETRDGRYLITLSGIVRFHPIGEPMVLTPYRQCSADYAPFSADFRPAAGEQKIDREGIIRAFRAFAKAKQLEIDWESVDAAPNAALVNVLSSMGPFGLKEKQTLLEAADLKSRADTLIALTRFELARDDNTQSSLQ